MSIVSKEELKSVLESIFYKSRSGALLLQFFRDRGAGRNEQLEKNKWMKYFWVCPRDMHFQELNFKSDLASQEWSILLTARSCLAFPSTQFAGLFPLLDKISAN